jgi:enterobactin synthetase component D
MVIEFNIEGVSVVGYILPFDSWLENDESKWLPVGMEHVAKVRKKEYLAGRYCAVKAAEQLGVQLSALPSAPTREPIWPDGLVGSITHSKRMAIGCVSTSKVISSLGIDAEELIQPSVSLEVETIIATDSELALLKRYELPMGITLLFSAKEALYKALYPRVRTFIDFKEVTLIHLDRENGCFELELKSSDERLTNYLGLYTGFYKQFEETIVTLVCISCK